MLIFLLYHPVECRLEVDGTVTIEDQNNDQKKFSYWGEKFSISVNVIITNLENAQPIMNIVQMVSKENKNVPRLYLNSEEKKLYAEYEGNNGMISISKEFTLNQEIRVEIKQSISSVDNNYQFCLKFDNNVPDCKVIADPEELHDVQVFMAKENPFTKEYGTVTNLFVANLECFHGKKYVF